MTTPPPTGIVQFVIKHRDSAEIIEKIEDAVRDVMDGIQFQRGESMKMDAIPKVFSLQRQQQAQTKARKQ